MVLRYWIGLNAADALLTGVGLALGAVEANPLLNLFAEHLGHPGMLFVKTLSAIAIGGILWERRKTRILRSMNFIMLGVVFYNMLIITYTA